MVYYISRGRQDVHHAGGKAPNDIYALCERRGWQEFLYPSITKTEHRFLFHVRRGMLVLLFWCSALFRVRPGDVIFYQHPVRYGSKIACFFLRMLKKRNVKFIVLIHDLDSLRYQLLWSEQARTNVHFEDGEFLKQFDAVICHNEYMKEYLISTGVASDKLICLELFDYLLDEPGFAQLTEEDSLVVAGNLSAKKCGYIYELPQIGGQYHFNLYGLNYDDSIDHSRKLVYKGSFSPEKLPSVLSGKYGLVWDGNSIESCEGPAGNYLRFNNPHKFSLYMAAGIPVVAWKKAAIAPLINKYKLGVTVDSLRELSGKLQQVSEVEYEQMRDHVAEIRQQVISGHYFNQAIERALRLVEEK